MRRGAFGLGAFTLKGEQTHITLTAPVEAAPRGANEVPCLTIRDPSGDERLVFLDASGAAATVLGRSPDCDAPLSDGAVSRNHVSFRRVGDSVEVTDLNSTNGTFLQGVRLQGSATVEPGQLVQLGKTVVMVDWRDPAETAAAQELAEDLERAARYVTSLLPERIEAGPIRLDWHFEPSTKLGGDVFGWQPLDARHAAGFLIDVTGHGVGAAMHSTAILTALRQRTLPNTDFRDPGQVLTRLNDTFGMDAHDGFCFTIWYGVYDQETRQLRFGSGGHHPSYLVSPLGGAPMPLRLRGPLMGVMEAVEYESASITVPPGARLHIFSDGCFEITARDGRAWKLADFLPLLSGAEEGVAVSAAAVHAAVKAEAGAGPLADDFSIMSVTFD